MAEIGGVRADVMAEIGGVRADVMAEIGGVRAEFTAETGSIRADIERLRAEIKESKISIILWLTGIMAGLTAAQIGAVVALLKAWPG